MNLKLRLYDRFVLPTLGLIVLALVSCTRDEDPTINLPNPNRYSAEIALQYHELFLDLERYTTGYRPPVSARSSAYISWIGYETIVSALPNNNSLGTYLGVADLPQPDPSLDYHWPIALVEAYSEALEYFFPTAPAEILFRIYELRARFLLDFKQGIPNAVFVRSTAYGREVAAAICAFSATDAVGHEAYLRNNDPTYIPTAGPGTWQPTFPDFSPALLPRWGQARTFAADATDVAPPPLTYSENSGSAIYQQALEAYNLVNSINAGNSEEAHWLAEFWSDDCPILTFTPSGRWYAVANQLVVLNEMDLGAAV